ncbi:MAG: prepilin-type N-terminal cleavage/methylation domain-containing protein [Planctomycetes bacterium]|nr:prepilin-type N-terminal cleavage/methylation domain-containing protein [Planctomycetota bacterium]
MSLSSSRRAFTLLELLLVLAVVAVLAALAAPWLSGSLRGQRLDGQARTVIALSRKARALAAAEGRTYELVVEPELKTLRLARQRDPLAPPTDPEQPERELASEDEMWSRPLPFEEGVVLVEGLDGEDEPFDLAAPIAIRFAPDGSSDACELAFGAGTKQVRVRIQARLGRATLVEPTASQP